MGSSRFALAGMPIDLDEMNAGQSRIRQPPT